MKRTLTKAAARVAAAAGLTFNSLIVWLNATFNLKIPVLPLDKQPSVLQSLWELPIAELPIGEPPYDVPLEGSWPALFLQVGSPPVQLENIVVHVRQKTSASPD